MNYEVALKHIGVNAGSVACLVLRVSTHETRNL